MALNRASMAKLGWKCAMVSLVLLKSVFLLNIFIKTMLRALSTGHMCGKELEKGGIYYPKIAHRSLVMGRY